MSSLLLRVLCYTAVPGFSLFTSGYVVWGPLSDSNALRVLGIITAATNVTALMFLVALSSRRVRRVTGNAQRGRVGIAESSSNDRRGMCALAFFPAGAIACLLLVVDLIMTATGWDLVFGCLVLAITAVVCMRLAVRAIASMWRTTRYTPLASMALAGVLSHLLSFVAMVPWALRGFPELTELLLFSWGIGILMTSFAAVIALRAVPAGKR